MNYNFLKEEFRWKRPSTIPLPTVWTRFETKMKNGVSHRVKIQDVTPDRFEEFIDFMESNFDTDEPLSKSLNTVADTESMSTLRKIRRKILNQNICVIAVLDDDNPKPEIIAANLLYVSSKQDSPTNRLYNIDNWERSNGAETLKKLYKFTDTVSADIDEFAIIGGDTCIKEDGIGVAREYRGFNLSFHLVSNIANMARVFGISGAAQINTCFAMQLNSRKAGFRTYKEIEYSNYKDENGEIVFQIKEERSVTYTIIKFPME